MATNKRITNYKDFYQFYYGLPIDMDKYLDVNNE